VRETDSAAFEYIALFDDARSPAAAFRAFPGIGEEGFAVNSFQRRDDALLEVLQIGFNG
jgi:hypothetical protein